MTLTVLLFAHLRDRLGPAVEVTLPAGATVADLRARLPIDGCRVADGYLDSVTYGILEDEWRARRGPDAT